jgi:hypothetical protein
MNAKWPFIVITITLLMLFGYMIARLDRATIMANWTDRRCDIPVMFAGFFFKPEEDPRSTSDFAGDNFSFCMKSYVDSFLAIMLAPVNALFSKHVSIAGGITDVMTLVRTIAQKMYSSFASYLDQYFRRFNATVFEISRVMQYVRMAMKRMSGIMMSMIYAGISIFNGIINSIQFIIRVVLIVCTILLILIIILFFILFPVIPIILATLGTIVATVLILTGIMDASIAEAANSKKGGFCFAASTQMNVMRNGQWIEIPMKDVKVGDEIKGGRITATIEMNGTDVTLYQIGSVFISGSHLIRGIDSHWRSVDMDERAVKTNVISDRVYCFNTTSNIIEVDGYEFRDWEEIANDDEKGQIIWNYTVSTMINKGAPFIKWRDNLKNYVNMALVAPEVRIKTASGFVPIQTLTIGDTIMDAKGEQQRIYGIIWGEVEGDKTFGDQWITELYEWTEGVWIKGRASLYPGVDRMEGVSLITENGECIIWDSIQKKEKRIRDFTEVGYKSLYKTYAYVDARLRMKE